MEVLSQEEHLKQVSSFMYVKDRGVAQERDREAYTFSNTVQVTEGQDVLLAEPQLAYIDNFNKGVNDSP
jgi:hypothetical protein